MMETSYNKGVFLMSLLDSVLGQVGGNLDIAGLAAKLGIDPATAQSAVAALGQAHAAPGDTVETAASATGIPTALLGQVAGALGGAEGLGKISELLQGNPALSSLTGMLDKDGDGNPVNDLLGMAKGLFGN